MSWDASLRDTDRIEYGAWNYTHNVAPMIYAALQRNGTPVPDGEPWWGLLNGIPGPDGAALLHRILRQFDADEEFYRAMNPGNGWGNFDQLRELLTEMRDAVPERVTTWETCG